MRKLLVTAALGAMALGMVPSHASHGESEHTYGGAIKVSTAGSARVHRCAYALQGESSQGIFGYTIPVTAGWEFTLASPSASLTEDIGIAFYVELTPCEANSATAGAYTNHDSANEGGTVPDGATVAIVTLDTGLPDTSFTYHEIEV